jgi:hypothetical protein
MPGRVADPILLPPGRRTGTLLAEGASHDGLVAFAIRVAAGSVAERGSFHAGYRSAAADPGIDRLEVITELRRLVLLTELRGAPGWRDAAEARAALDPYRGKLTVDARVRFHPERGYTSLPRLELHLGSSMTMQPALDLHVEPVHGPIAADGSAAVVGAVVEATFATPPVRGVHTLIIHVDATYLLVATIDLSRMP